MSHSGVGSGYQRTFPLQKSSSGGRTSTVTAAASAIDSGLGNPQQPQQPHGLSSTLASQSQPYYGESSFNWKTSSSSRVQDCFVTPTRVRRAASTASAKNPVTAAASTTSSHGPRGGSLSNNDPFYYICTSTMYFAKWGVKSEKSAI